MNASFRKLSFIVLLMLLVSGINAQNLTGIWRGYFVTEDGEQYKLEFQVQQNPTQAVTGVSYSYLDKRFYGKATMTGRYSTAGKTFQIQELRTVEVRNLGGGGTCIMNYKLLYSRSGREEFLEGTFVGKTEDRLDPKNNGVWGDCGKGKVFLRRVIESDFYIEPFLRKDKPTTTNPPVVKKQTPVTTGPQVKKQTPPVTRKEQPVVKRPRTDSIARQPQVIVEQPAKKIAPALKIPKQTRFRENELLKTVIITSPEITVKLYDNGEIDDDTITVYMDDQVVLSKKRLSAMPLTITLKLDTENPEHVLVMVADNLGRIPPNTSLMIVNDGDKRHEVRITSTEQKNAMVRFRYQKE
jgi:hypothetical protein